MLWRLVSAYPDYLFQLTTLLSDPLYHGVSIPRGNGEPVLLIPGFLTSDRALSIMGQWLTRIGYQVYFSGIHWNIDCPNKTSELLRARLENITRETRSPLVVVGHSLGGVLARFLGATFPEYIRHVVALGSPIDGSMRVHPWIFVTFRTLHWLRQLTGALMPPCAQTSHLQCICPFSRTAFSPLPMGVGFTAIFSQQDEIVDWHACLDLHGENRPVSGQHIGLIVNKEVYRILARTLARQAFSPRSAAGNLVRRPRNSVAHTIGELSY